MAKGPNASNSTPGIIPNLRIGAKPILDKLPAEGIILNLSTGVYLVLVRAFVVGTTPYPVTALNSNSANAYVAGVSTSLRIGTYCVSVRDKVAGT